MKRVVIGVGNAYRRDDAIGLEVARRIRAEDPRGVEVLEHDGEPAGLLDSWEGADVAYVIDAVRGKHPGRIHRIEIGPEGATGVPPAKDRDSSHALGLGDAVELGRVLGRLPRRLVLLGIEGTDFAAGEGIDEAVARAGADVAARLARELSV